MAASFEQLTRAQKEEREVLDFLLSAGAVLSFKHFAGTSRDWKSHIDASIALPDGEKLDVDLKRFLPYGFILEHQNRYLKSTGSAHGKQDAFLVHSLKHRWFALFSRQEVLGLGLSHGAPPDRMTMPRVKDEVRKQPDWAYTGNTETNDRRTGGKKPCYDVVQKIPYKSLVQLPSWKCIQL